MRNGWIGYRGFPALFVSILMTMACAARSAKESQPITLKTFEGTYNDIWNVTLQVVHDEKNVPVKQASKEIGVISSDWVTEERTVFDGKTKTYRKTPSRYRLNLSLRRAPAPNLPPGIERITITVSKHVELKANNDWKAIASDLETEDRILASISQILDE